MYVKVNLFPKSNFFLFLVSEPFLLAKSPRFDLFFEIIVDRFWGYKKSINIAFGCLYSDIVIMFIEESYNESYNRNFPRKAEGK